MKKIVACKLVSSAYLTRDDQLMTLQENSWEKSAGAATISRPKATAAERSTTICFRLHLQDNKNHELQFKHLFLED